ncbi:LysR family transcriptional regulator [Clostridium sp.]|uniref:LysR family transcriptional regulator n=1 Tax=Clostridium sp. TaxID=1506 RepID=UPI002617FAFC|nr:LysR family transcriptional regulator [Clostridium sp.]
MHIDSLNYFFEVAKAKNISIVAKNSHISQSALSQQIQKLENSLNVKLFDRNNKGVSLTPEGNILLKYSETILNAYGKMQEELIDSINKKKLIYIESIESLTLTILPVAISKLNKIYSSHKINLNISNNSSNDNLLNNISDILLTYFKPQKNDNLINKLIGYDEMVLVTSNNSKVNNISKLDLPNLPLICIYNKNNLQTTIFKELSLDKSIFEQMNLIYRTDSYISALNSLHISDAYTFIPKSIYNNYHKNFDIKIVEIVDFSLSFPVYISYKEGFYKLNVDYIKAFKKIIKDYLI